MHMNYIFRVILGIVMIAVGFFSMLGIWVPSLRGQWKGRQRIEFGRLSCAGFGLMFTLIGLTFILGDAVKLGNFWSIVLVIAVFSMALIGWLLDSRR
jgi:hypothetical protein